VFDVDCEKDDRIPAQRSEGRACSGGQNRGPEPTIPLFASGNPDLAHRADEYLDQMALPPELQALPDGSPMPNVVRTVRRSRIGH
jgi:hypothetical protein